MQGASKAPAAAARQKELKPGWGKRLRDFKENSPYLLMILPAILVVFLFNYLPIYGVLIAFQDFMPGDPILSRDTIWVGFQNFTRFFNDVQFWPLMKNTFLLCIIGFIIGFPLPILVSLALNALKRKKAGKVFQTIYTAPLAASLGGERVSYFLESSAFRPMYILSSNWQDFGWSAVIYIAALSNVDPVQHEAAMIDGATRFQRVLHVDIPAIMPMISVMLIMSIGGLMGVGYEKALLMQTDGNLAVSELIATYVYKRGLTGVPDQAYATAIGLFNSVINVVLLIIANTTSKRFSENSLW